MPSFGSASLWLNPPIRLFAPTYQGSANTRRMCLRCGEQGRRQGSEPALWPNPARRSAMQRPRDGQKPPVPAKLQDHSRCRSSRSRRAISPISAPNLGSLTASRLLDGKIPRGAHESSRLDREVRAHDTATSRKPSSFAAANLCPRLDQVQQHLSPLSGYRLARFRVDGKVSRAGSRLQPR